MDEIKKAERHVRGSKNTGEKVLRRTGPKNTQFKVIYAASGTPTSSFNAHPQGQKISLTAKESGPSMKAKRNDQFNRNSVLVNQYLKWLEDQGHKLPENAKQKGKVYYAQLAAEAGVDPNAFALSGKEKGTSSNVRLRSLIEIAAARIGTEIRVLPQSPGHIPPQVSYEVLLARGTAERERELEGRRGARQQLYNTRAALNRLRKYYGLNLGSPVGGELTATLKKSVGAIMEVIHNQNSRKKFQTEILWWHDFYRRLVKEQYLPEDFQGALAYLVDRSGLTPYVLAKLVGMQSATLYGWYHGKKTPASPSLAFVSRIESLFRLPSGTLTNKVRKWRLVRNIHLSQLPESIRQNRSLANRVRQHLPEDFLDHPEDKRREIVEYIRDSVLKFNDAHTQRLVELQPLTYSLRRWPAPLEAEFSDLALFKTAERPSLGMRRNEQWRDTTKAMIRTRLAQFFGALHLSEDAEDERLRGLGLPQEHLSLVLLACPLLVDWYVHFHCEVRNIYTEHALTFIEQAISLLRRGTGWLRQSPALASRLRPIAHGHKELVSADLIARARANWDGVCDDAIEQYGHMAEEIKPLIKISRDPFARIEGILEMDAPIDAFEILAAGMRNDLPNPQTRPTVYHTAIRDSVLILLIQLTGLRRNTVAQLNYTVDGAGYLKLKRATYVLEIPRQLFKEEHSPYFGTGQGKVDYYMELLDIYGFYALLTEYLKVSRPFLLERFHPGDKEQALFVTSVHPKSTRVSPSLVHRIYSDATGKHLVENKYCGTGIPMVGRHGPHSARHIRGTSIVKNGGSFQDAANANQNSVRTALQHYARWSSKDKNRQVNDVLFGKKKKKE